MSKVEPHYTISFIMDAHRLVTVFVSCSKNAGRSKFTVGYCSLTCVVIGQLPRMWPSVCIWPQGHSRSSRGIRDHLPFSIIRLCEESLSFVVIILLCSCMDISLYIGCTLNDGFISVKYVTNLDLFDLDNRFLICNRIFCDPKSYRKTKFNEQDLYLILF